MDDDIQPAANAVFRGVLPGLQAVTMVEIMRWLPIVEDFITILNWCIRCRKQVDKEKCVESSDWIDQRLIGRPPQWAEESLVLAGCKIPQSHGSKMYPGFATGATPPVRGPLPLDADADAVLCEDIVAE